MPSYTEIVDTAKDRVIDTIGQVRDLTVSAVESASKAVGRLIPSLSLPLADQLPAPTEVVETGFGFAEELLDAQKKYALAVLDALSPITEKVAGAKPKSKRAKAAHAA